MLPLSIIVDPIGGWLALAFLSIFICKAALAAFGGDVDHDFDDGTSTDFDVDSDGLGISTSDFFSLKGFLNFSVGFTSYWALFGLTPWWNSLLAVVTGVIFSFILLFAYRACMKLDSTIITESPDDLLFRHANVYSINDNGIIIQTEMNGRIDEILVQPDDNFTFDDFKTGDDVYISHLVKLDDTHTRYKISPYSEQ